MDYERDDAMLFELLNEKKNIVSFLSSIFGFLARRTDFYHIKSSPNERIGFPAGLNEKLLLDIFRKYDKNIIEVVEAPEVIKEVEISSTDVINETIDEEPKKEQVLEKNKHVFNSSEHYNGAAYDDYCWSQTLSDIEVHVKLPPNIESARRLKVNIEANSIEITDSLNPKNVILQGDFYAKCRHKEAVWNISKDILQINLDKFIEDWWPKFLTFESKIDTTKIDCEQLISDMPQHQQNAIEKVTLDRIRAGEM